MVIQKDTFFMARTRYLFLLLIFCVNYAVADTVSVAKPLVGVDKKKTDFQTEPLWVTVFVHGILSIKPHLTTNNFIRFMKDKVEDTYYEKSIAIMRENEFFYKNQAMGPIGLHYIDSNSTSIHDSSKAMVYIFNQMGEFAGLNQKNNRYYLFGWTGLLSAKGRYEDGKKLFELLDKEVQRLKTMHSDVRVRVIGYSHGGNVALNLGAAHRDCFPDSSLVIDELILLGTPIQHDTDYLINDEVFKRVYNIYSLSDRVQKLDFFSLRRFFSGRTFAPYRGFELPDKLVQIQLKVMRNRKSKRPEKIAALAKDRDARGIESGRSRFIRNASPGHAELWAFGWTPQHYRRTFPLYPLPCVSLIPFIVRHIDGLADNHIIFDVRPEQEYIMIKNRWTKKLEAIVPFMSQEKLAALKDIVVTCAPENYTKQEYARQTDEAIKVSQEIYKDLYAPKGKKRFAKRCKVKRHKRNRGCN